MVNNSINTKLLSMTIKLKKLTNKSAKKFKNSEKKLSTTNYPRKEQLSYCPQNIKKKEF